MAKTGVFLSSGSPPFCRAHDKSLIPYGAELHVVFDSRIERAAKWTQTKTPPNTEGAQTVAV